ncbi:FG-GAP repeat domain-containing protein [Micromonospora musae]|uniref:FG-GAP repeat domain-containing protein n=1 Tax=Micromonospora musae TaxID=1894970 RepID=UPI00341C37F1
MGRSLTASTLASTLVLGLLTAPAVPATADPGTAPREITVIPESPTTTPATETLVFAGRTGFLHRHNNKAAYLWTRYDDGETIVVEDLAGMASTALKPAGGDSIYTTAQVPARPAPGKVSVLRLSDETWQQWEVPAQYAMWGVYGQRMLVRKQATDLELELRTFEEDGSSTTTPVTGIPAGSKSAGLPRAGDELSVIVDYLAPQARAGLLDLSTATVRTIPGASISQYWRLSGDTMGWMRIEDEFRLYSRSGVTSGTDTSYRTVTVPSDSIARSGVVDGGLVISRDADRDEYFPAISVPAQEGAARPTLLPKVAWNSSALIQAPDGAVLVVGGSDSRDWAVYRVTAEPGQPATAVPVLPVNDPVENAGLTYHQGLVRHVQTQVSPTTSENQYAVFSHPIAPDASITTEGAILPAAVEPCSSGARCVRLVEGNRFGAAYLERGTSETVYYVHDKWSATERTELPTTNGRIVDASGDYVLVRDGQADIQYVFRVGAPPLVWSGPVRGAALSFNTLWMATGTPGQLTAISLSNNRTTRTVSTGAPCVPTEVQANDRWLWWACGPDGPAGVHDLQSDRGLALPAGPVLLGDGFVVRHDTASASLQLTDFHDGTRHAPVKLADLAAGDLPDSRNLTWAVDKHGNGVAYVDADNAVHVLDTGVPGTPPTIGLSRVSAGAFPRTGNQQWSAAIYPTRPLSSWELTVRRKWTGEVVHRAAGTNARMSVFDDWDGRLPSGEFALNGAYGWTLTGKPTEASASMAIGSGESLIRCGSFPFRGYACDGGPGLLGVRSTGEATWYGTQPLSTPPGQLDTDWHLEYWCLSCSGAERTSALVPFGDFNGDAYPDLLVRDGNGGMKAHLGNGQLDFGGRQTKSLGAGWMMYKSILAPGDLNSDGHDDILGVDADGKLWLYTTTGKSGINSRVQVGSGWNMYTRILGAGDLNGDGHGDLLGVDSTGVMYAYFSNGNKGWSSRVKVFAGWNIYNTIVAIGDLNEDGRNDLVARDPNGLLWSYAGLGNGSFATRVQAGAGWNMYKIII